MTTITKKVFSLIRADGTVHHEADTEKEVSDFGKLPRGWKWEPRTYQRVGYIGPNGGFIETKRERTK